MGSSQVSDPEDPLSDFSVFSLFPRTFHQCSPDSGSDPCNNGLLETVGAHLKSMALKNPNRLLEQAKSVLDGGLESISVGNLVNARDEDKVAHLVEVNHEKLQGRRPALGRKRARFSLKQNFSQPVECLEPFVEIDKLLDPEEFFSAFEKHENAKNELKRQRGSALMELDQNVPSMAERRRRPGLLRKSASYKHRFATAPSGDYKTILSSQETYSQNTCSPSNDGLQTQSIDENPVSSTRELSGSVAARTDRPNDVCAQLQSGRYEDDEGDEILEMLQERFKPIELKKTCLPDLSGVHRSEFKTLGKPLLDSQEKTSDLHNVVSAIGKEKSLGFHYVERSSVHPPTSLTQPKSPYASISLLKARLFKSRRATDSFSALDFDVSPLGNATSCEDTHDLAAGNEIEVNMAVSEEMQDLAAAELTFSERSSKGTSMMPCVPSDATIHAEANHDVVKYDKRDESSKSPEHVKESDTGHTTETVKGSSKVSDAFSDCTMHIELNHESVDNNKRDQNPKSAAHEKGSNTVRSKDMHDAVAENFAPAKGTTEDSSVMSDIALNNTTQHIELDHDITANDTMCTVLGDNPSQVLDDAVITANEHIELDDRVGDAVITANEHIKLDDRVSDGNAQDPNMETSNLTKEKLTPGSVEDLEKGMPSSDHDKQSSGTASAIDELDHDRPSSSQAERSKETDKASSQMSEYKSNKRRKGKEPSHAQDTDFPDAEKSKATAATRQTRERKEFSQRKSLAACGTLWESGLRRSTRIRTRPLEFWKGERQLYGRIHKSLVTVIGTKYLSPTKETGQPTLKVKSYVSDNYKEIVELAALH